MDWMDWIASITDHIAHRAMLRNGMRKIILTCWCCSTGSTNCLFDNAPFLEIQADEGQVRNIYFMNACCWCDQISKVSLTRSRIGQLNGGPLKPVGLKKVVQLEAQTSRFILTSDLEVQVVCSPCGWIFSWADGAVKVVPVDNGWMAFPPTPTLSLSLWTGKTWHFV